MQSVDSYSSQSVLPSAAKREDFSGSFTAFFTRSDLVEWLYLPVGFASAKVVILGPVFAKASFVFFFSEHWYFLCLTDDVVVKTRGSLHFAAADAGR